MKGCDGRMQRFTLFYVNVCYLENPVTCAKKSICPRYQTHPYTEGKVLTGFKKAKFYFSF